MTKRMKITIAGLILVFGGIILFHLVKSFMIKRFFAHYQPPAITISTVVAEKKNWYPTLEAVGNFVAMNGVEVNSQTSGNVTTIHFNSGEYIEKGMPLIDIDDSIEQATLKFNEADKILKNINYTRQADLLKRGATSSSTVDESKANLKQSEANVEKIRAQIGQKHISAPFSGQLGIRQVNLGQYITPGQTSIVTLQSLDPLYLEFNLPEQMFKQLHINQNLQFKTEEFKNMSFGAKITAINPKADIGTHNILVQATVPNCPLDALKKLDKKYITITDVPGSTQQTIGCNSTINQENNISKFVFIPGMFASISIEQPSIPDVIVLPSTSISYSLYGNSVFIVEKSKDQKDEQGKPILTVKRTFVTTGEQQGNYTTVTKGVAVGDVVVSSGELKLDNGARVIVDNSNPLPDSPDPSTLGE